jgi:hypothetical protein
LNSIFDSKGFEPPPPLPISPIACSSVNFPDEERNASNYPMGISFQNKKKRSILAIVRD